MPIATRPSLYLRRHQILVVSWAVLMLVAFASNAASSNDEPAETVTPQAAAIVAIARQAMADNHLRAIILRVTIDGSNIVTTALGSSKNGVPATHQMHFRNGAVAISYMATLLLQLVDKNVIALDDQLSNWLPALPDSDRVTLRMLANMTAGYPDYVRNAHFIQEFSVNPYRQWTSQELIDIGLSTPRIFDPGTNWDYSHTNYVILGQALEKITGTPLAVLMRDNVLRPLALRNTRSAPTSVIQPPVLHAFSSERREAMGIPPSEPFYEDSTYWNPSWTLAEGAVQTTNIYDMTATADAIGTGSLLSPELHTAQVAPSLIGFGHPEDGCPTCHTLDTVYSYGLGVVISGSWILQNPLFGGYGSVEAYLPSQKLAIALAVTFEPAAFNDTGDYIDGHVATHIVSLIATYMTGQPLPQ